MSFCMASSASVRGHTEPLQRLLPRGLPSLPVPLVRRITCPETSKSSPARQRPSSCPEATAKAAITAFVPSGLAQL
jgi:hypothetical protein